MAPITHVETDGVSLAVETVGMGPALLFSHGLTDNRIQGRRLLEPQLDRYRFVLFDQRGHGNSSPVTDAAFYEPERMTADIKAVMDSLGVEQAVVGGESMGSATALLFALRWPDRVKKLVLFAPAFGDRPNPGKRNLVALGRELSTRAGVEAHIARARVGDWRENGLTPDAMEMVAGYLRSHEPASVGAACKAVARWVILRDLAELGALNVPVHIVAWEGDPIHPVALAERMAAILPNARLHVVPSSTVIFNDVAGAGRLVEDFLAA